MTRNTLQRLTLALLAAFILSPATTLAQTRKRTTTKSKSSPTAATQRANEVRTVGATRVADQIKFLTKFIYLLGGVQANIASVDESVRRKEAPATMAQKNEQNKTAVKSSITGFRDSLDKLEIDFRTTPELQPYYIKLAGVAAGAADAEALAATNQFDQSGRKLLDVVNHLADVLVAMRQ
jgi:hypothetical protein